MRLGRTPLRPWLMIGGLGAGLLLSLEGLRLLNSAPFSWRGLLGRTAFVSGVLLAARLGRPEPCQAQWRWPWPAPAVATVAGLAGIGYALSQSTAAAWLALAASYSVLIACERVLTHQRGPIYRWTVRGLLAVGAGVGAVAVGQIESHFADEEFFAAIQALELALLWLLLLGAVHAIWRTLPPRQRAGLRLSPRLIGALLPLIAGVAFVPVVLAYQRSFYPPVAPAFAGISAQQPFLSARLPADASGIAAYDGRQVFARLLAHIEANPNKGTPEYGMLALGEHECCWAQRFRDGLLDEASQALFTGPAYSVKSAQLSAALRVYYYTRVRAAYPELFTPEDDRRLRTWFAAINQRALTVEWVDWMYALALGQRPAGPYENQEIGAALLAILEADQLAPPDRSPDNRAYLDRRLRGWDARFRNIDDALFYQIGWIDSALFQSLYTQHVSAERRRLSFEWILLQALPDGAPLGYNHPDAVTLATIAYLGATSLDDPRYVWLAGRALDYLESHDGLVYNQPGVAQPIDLAGRTPTEGTSLLYGDSGMPGQIGPLAPDKIIFRDGWSADSLYLMLNLRFTGWHRYKATNTLTLLYQDGPLVADDTQQQAFSWLPQGRSAFRDKRIPRELLNGLLIERNGMSAALYDLTGVGGPWAQDPPYYAQVERFEPGADHDVSSTVLEGWRGWRHRRTIYFYHHGPVVVADDASGPAGAQAALVWHLAGKPALQGDRIRLRSGAHPAEMLLLPTGATTASPQIDGPTDGQVLYQTSSGQLGLATVFLTGPWVGAQVELRQVAGQPLLRITKGDQQLELRL